MPRGPDTASVFSQNTVNTVTTSNSVGGRSIYPRGPQFSLDTFASKDFIVKDFVESLSDGAAQNVRRSNSQAGKTFDPKTYIRVFEHALNRLGQLSDQRETHEHELAGAVRRAQAQHKQHCSTLQRKLDQALETFTGLEQRVGSTFDGRQSNEYSEANGNASRSRGGGALGVGDRLQELDWQKKRAEDAKLLIQCWQDVSERGDLARLEDMRRLRGGEGKVSCARMARQLLKISNTLERQAPLAQTNGLHVTNGNSTMNGTGQTSGSGHNRKETNELIERFLERLETDLLEQFDVAKRQHDERGMRDCATALHDFGEGASVIGRFVAQHDFFLERSHVVSEPVNDDTELWERLADPDADPLGVEQSLQALVDEVKLVLEEESFVIKLIFPYHEQVLITFLQRIFQQSIQQRLEMVLEKAASISALAFLRTLQAARNYIGTMVDQLKGHGLTEHPDSASLAVVSVLDQQFEVLFVPYSTGSSYIERERQSLEELYSSLLFRFTIYHSRRRKNPNSYLGSLGQKGRDLLSSAKDRYMEKLESSELGPSQKALLLRLAGIRDSDARAQTEVEVTEEDGKLSLPVAKRMLKWLAEAVGRGLELGGGSETPKDVSFLLRLLLTNLGDIYLDTALDAANDQAASQENTRNEPDLSFIPDIRIAINILQLMLSICHSVLLPLASANMTFKREMDKTIASNVSRMEEKLGNVTNRTLDVALNWVAKLLSRQNRAEFRPRDETMDMEQLQTPTCRSIFVFLSQVRDMSLTAFEGRNQEAFFTELAIGLRSLLFDHFKKFQVNLAGGLMVSKDITKYIELLRTFPVAASFLPSLEVLIEVGNIFVIGPEALKDRLRGGGALTGVDKADLRPYILKRDDVGTIGVQSVLNAL